MVNIADDQFGNFFYVNNIWLIFSVFLVLVEALPLPRALQRILTLPAMIRVKLGTGFTLQIAHIVILINAGVLMMLYGNLSGYQKPAVQETPVIKNIRLSKKWQYETYIYQSCICLACWLYVMKFVSLNDYKKELEDQLLGNDNKKNQQKKEEQKRQDKVEQKEQETRRPKDDVAKKND